MAYRLTQAYLMTRLPAHYVRFRNELTKPPSPVHYVPESAWKHMPDGQISHFENFAIPLHRIPQEDEGLWGGESIIKGFKKKFRIRRNPHFWVPHLHYSLVYSEILNKHMKIVTSPRTSRLIDENQGFDYYILKTPIQDLRSQLGYDLRRKMLLALVRKDMWTDDPKQQQFVYNKYKDYIIPEEEAEWFGLSLLEALRKQRDIEVKISTPVPNKVLFRQELLQKLIEWKNTKDQKEEITSWFPKLNLFGRK